MQQKLAQTHYRQMSGDVEFILALAKLETELNHHDIAGDWLAHGLIVDPNKTELYLRLAQNNWTKGAQELAMSTLQQGLQKAPGDPDLLELRGDYSYAQKDYPDAIRDWRRVIETDSRRIRVYEKMVNHALEIGDRNSARMIIQRGRGKWSKLNDWDRLEKKVDRSLRGN